MARNIRLCLEALGWCALALALVVLLPLFVCMPLCGDVELYDSAALNVLQGGAQYREIFDTNLPGMVWAHLLFRPILGWRSEAIRLVDMAVVAAIIWLLVTWFRPLGVSRSARVWMAFLLAVAYLTTSEWCHCQRDTWMLLPSLAALHLRRRQLATLVSSESVMAGALAAAPLEGFVWALAFWVKPFVIVPALCCWLTSALVVLRSAARPVRLVVLDGAGVLTGALLAGLLGVGWLMWSDSWGPFWDVFLHWNPEYVATNRVSQGQRLMYLATRLTPWNLAHMLAVPVAGVVMLRFVKDRARGQSNSDLSPLAQRALLAAFYLGWLLQVEVIQKRFDYVLVPPMLMALPLAAEWIASRRRWQPVVAVLVVSVVLIPAQQFLVNWDRQVRHDEPGALAAVAKETRRATWERLESQVVRLVWWGRCWSEGSTPRVKNALKLTTIGYQPDWECLEDVADWLRKRALKDGELTCYYDSSHHLYLELHLKPSTPYLQFGNTLTYFPKHHDLIRRQLQDSPQRYVVSDLRAVLIDSPTALEGATLELPADFPQKFKHVFPWDLPIVFRSGPYTVHRVDGPVGPLVEGQAANP
jgi:hypothetical protein